jgi:hypothetical protein
MRDVKYVAGLLLLAASVLVTWACYLKSHGAGISMGILMTIVILSYLYDHGGHIFRGKPPAPKKDRSLALDLAMRQGRNEAVRGDAH